MTKLVVIESPFAGDVHRNTLYARAAMRDSLLRGEAPIASHLLYTQAGILDDLVPEERAQGINAGLEWAKHAELAVFYVDLGWSLGMSGAKALYEKRGTPFEERTLPGGWNLPLDPEPIESDGPGWRYPYGAVLSVALAHRFNPRPEFCQIEAVYRGN